MKWFFQTWWQSLTDIHFYQSLSRWSWSQTSQFALLSILALSLIASLRWQLVTIPAWRQHVTTIQNELLSNYPPSLTINWDNKNLRSSLAPLVIEFPTVISTSSRPTEHLAVITDQPLQLPEQSNQVPQTSFLVVTPTTLYLSDWRGSWNQLPLSDVPGFEQPFSITKDTLPGYSAAIAHEVNVGLQVWSGLVWFIEPIMIGISLLWLSLLNALLVWLVTQTLTFRQRFGQVWQRTLHIALVAELVSQLAWLIYGTQITWLFAITFWLITCLWVVDRAGFLRRPEEK